jgi:AraC-like DNA-binding protein
MGADALSDVLRAVRLTGAVFFNLDVRAPWVAEAPPAKECAPFVMPGVGHLIEFHVITKGTCWGGLLDEPPVRLETGDIIVFPQGDAHVLSSAPGMRFRPDMSVYKRPDFVQLPFSLTIGADRPEAGTVVCGFLGCDARPFNPLLATLPRLLHRRAGLAGGSSWLSHFISAAMEEAEKKQSGGESVLARLSELMFIEVVRGYIQSLPAEETGWLAGLRDRHVSRALNLLHDKPARGWTLDQLAMEVGLSRSSLAERFSYFVGQPPMQYLAQWRMQVAAQLLANGGDNVARVAAAVGYESEAAFSRAFKKLVGMPPAAWRKVQTS